MENRMNEPGTCPNCGSGDCDAPHMSVEGKTLTLWVTCCECGETHIEEYELTGKRMGWNHDER